ncbi:TPA: hypothetical protein ACPY8E_003986 [Yersinia enterocolitica]|uniref:hypothetical protein n=1 Tax=Yersinia enterocolitica TaxID=630 RepID=UPI0029BCFB88|nr:hypothetical protein [Yersinia enterocolitica]EKN5063248.1 hypothetical protein [Yersinia enterocolitica]ELW9026212.1 hypothetical protein [Yersinia enterocolitica]HEN3542019.1 hypothetical protein [Yersinia enterocolitica]
MNASLERLSKKLSELNRQLVALNDGSTMLCETYGWQYPAITPNDLNCMPLKLVEKINAIPIEELNDDDDNEIDGLSSNVDYLIKSTIPYIYNGNGLQAIPAYMATMLYINGVVEKIFSWEVLYDSKAMPRNLNTRLRSYNLRLEQLSPEIDKLKSKISTILDAHSAAEALPVDMEILKEARKEINRTEKEISEILFEIRIKREETEESLKIITEKKDESSILVEQCEDAFRVTTAKGLAGAFEVKADKLNASIRFWVGGLLIALSAGAYVGFERIKALSKILEQQNPSLTVIITQVILSALSIGAPLWFAWLSTKQISQRFKLAEDYAFKASVAKAYEGYRREAKQLDGDFENRLFAAALTRFEEEPLRLVKEKEHYTPWMEMIGSDSFKKFLQTPNEAKDLILNKLGFKVEPPKKTNEKIASSIPDTE